ncbi:MAG: hypothetical protein ACOH2K_13470 [Burkholderiaceae bacterium]
MSIEIRIPLTEVKVRFQAGSRRPITELDRMVMQAIFAGAKSVDSLRQIFQLPERLLVECLVDLMEMALLALDLGGDGFRLTEFGARSLDRGLSTFGERLDDVGEFTLLREDLTGRFGRRFWYEREKGDIPSQAVQGSIPLGEVERLLLQELKKYGKHLHSVESVVPVRDSISFKVTVDKGGISGLPSQWNHLQPLLIAEAEKRTGDSYSMTPQCEEQGDDSLWVETSLHEDDLLLTASNHKSALLSAIKQAHSHLLIVSAHVSEAMLDALGDPIKEAIQRGVRVDLLWGLPSLDEGGEPHAATTKKWLQEIRKSSYNGSGEYLMTNEEPLHSDAKVLVWDAPNGSYKSIVGSYNWLYGFDGSSAERPGSEVGIRLNDPRLIGNICSTVSGWLNARGKQSDSIALRWQQIGLYLAQQEPPSNKPGNPLVKACVLYDERHAEMLRESLVNATRRLLVTSHKLNRIATGSGDNRGGKLDWLTRRKPNPEFQFVLIAGKQPKPENWNQEDQRRLEELVSGANGSMRFEKRAHARVLVCDDMAIVSGYNFLSSTRDKRQVGVMFKDTTTVNILWDRLKAVGSAAYST